jgi:hypothetical protein
MTTPPGMKKFALSLAHDALIDSSVLRINHLALFPEGKLAAMIFAIGFAPITALALALMGMVSLPVATLVLVIPACVLALWLGYRHRGCGRLMLRGFLMGIVAVTVYDCMRIPFTMLGWIDDFIPKIGILLVGEGNGHAVVGYLWRYLGNGGGMGMAFVGVFLLLRSRFSAWHRFGAMKPALLFGCLVWVCLIGTLLIAPQGETMMFVISPKTLLISGIGHVVFGGTLGVLLRRDPVESWSA